MINSLNIKSSLRNNLLQFPYALSECFVNHTARMGLGRKCYQIFRSIIILDTIKVVDGVAFRERDIIIFLPIQYMFCDIIGRTIPPVFRTFLTMRMRIRVVYKYIAIFVFLATTTPRWTILAITMISKQTFMAITCFILPIYQFTAIITMLISFGSSFYSCLNNSHRLSFMNALRAINTTTRDEWSSAT